MSSTQTAREILHPTLTLPGTDPFLETKRTLRVPILGSLYQSWASHHGALALLWSKSRPNLQTIDFENKGDGLRSEGVEALMYDYAVPMHAAKVEVLLAPEDVETLRNDLDIFHYLGPKMLLNCVLVKGALGWLGYRGTGQPLGHIEPGIPQEAVPIAFADVPAGDPQLDRLLRDIRNDQNTTTLSDEYLALAKWPAYLQMAWTDLRLYHESPYYDQHRERILNYATRFISGLPYSVKVTSGEAEQHGTERRKLQQLIEPFFQALPRTMMDVALLKIALDGEEEALRSPFPVTSVARA